MMILVFTASPWAHRKIFQACVFSEILSIMRDSDACRIYTIRVFVKLLFFQNS